MVKEVINKIVSTKIEERNHRTISFDAESDLNKIGFDSLDVMEIIIEAEGELKKRIPNNRINGITTIGDLYNIFEEKQNVIERHGWFFNMFNDYE